MIKFSISYGVMDDFCREPKKLKITIKNSNVAYSLVIDKVGVEILRQKRGSFIFYDPIWSFDWRRHA